MDPIFNEQSVGYDRIYSSYSYAGRVFFWRPAQHE